MTEEEKLKKRVTDTLEAIAKHAGVLAEDISEDIDRWYTDKDAEKLNLLGDELVELGLVKSGKQFLTEFYIWQCISGRPWAKIENMNLEDSPYIALLTCD